MPAKSFFSKKKIVLIGTIVIIFIAFLSFTFIAARLSKNQSTSTNPNPDINVTAPEAMVYFNPTTINATPGRNTTVDIYVDTWGKEISGANISIKYNPNVITNVSLAQFRDNNSTVSLAFENAVSTVDPGKGIIELPLQMAKSTPMQKGRGKIATLSFTPKTTNITLTQLSFTPATSLITKTPQKVIVLQKSNLIVNYPVNGVFPTQPPIYK